MLYELNDVAVYRGDRTILDISKLVITPETVYSLVGPNGAGKTTLLNILAFLLRPDSGQLYYKGSAVEGSAKAYHQLRQRVVLVDQYPILFTGPVWKNIDFALKIRKVPAGQRKQRIIEVLERVGMQEFAHAEAHTLSGGETKRIALARALAINPDILLCDEPTANVDAENQERILDILSYCNKKQQTSLIFATHYLSQAQRLADQSIVLQNGSLAERGNDNIFSIVQVTDPQGEMCMSIGPGLVVKAPESLSASAYPPKRVQIDPRHVDLSSTPGTPDSGSVQWKGRLLKIEVEGDGVRATVDCGIRIDALLSGEQYSQESFLLGTSVYLNIPLGKCVFS